MVELEAEAEEGKVQLRKRLQLEKRIKELEGRVRGLRDCGAHGSEHDRFHVVRRGPLPNLIMWWILVLLIGQRGLKGKESLLAQPTSTMMKVSVQAHSCVS